MGKRKREPTTVYLDADIARAAKVKAALNDKSMSDIVSEALGRYLSEDASDLVLARKRKNQPARSYDELVTALKRDGLL